MHTMCEKYMCMVLSQRLRIAQEEGTHEKPVVTKYISQDLGEVGSR